MRGPHGGPVEGRHAPGVVARRGGFRAPPPRLLLAGAVVLLAGCFIDQLTSSGPDTSGINALITGDSLVALGGRQPLDFQITGITASGPSRRVWSTSDASIATVDSTGLVTGTGIGLVTITGRLTAPELDSGVVRTHAMRVRYASIKIDAVDSLEGLGRTVTLVARGRDSAGAAVAPVAATFTVPNALVVSVTTGGLVTALHKGDATVTATFDNLTDQITVPVRQVVKSVQFAINNLVFPSLNRDTAASLVVKDVGDSIIPSPTVNWSSNDPTAVTVNVSSGVMRALKVAPATITAQVDTAHGQLNTSVVQVPVSLAPSAGNNQSDTVGLAVAIPPCVVATDAGTSGVANLAVTFSVTAGGGGLTGGAPLTSASGVACVGSWTLGTAAGTNTMHAAAGTLTTDLTAHGVAGTPTQIARIAGDSQTATVGTAVTTPPRVRVQDTFGNPDSGVVVTFAVVLGGGSITGALDTTDANGVAQVGSWTLGSLSGTNTLTASINAGAITTTFTAAAGASGPATVTVSSGAGQTAPVGTAVPVPPSVRVTDAYGNPVSSVAVSFGASTGNGVLTGSNPSTNTSGFATVGSWMLDTIVGKDTIVVTSSGLPPDTVIATSVAGAAVTLDVVAGDLQTDTVGSSVTVAPSVIVTDAYGNVKSGVTVTFTVLTGGGSVTGATKITNASGIATVGSWTLGPTAGSNNNTLRASAGALAYTFTASALHGPAVSITKISGDGQVGAPGGSLASPYIVRVVDAFSNGVGGVLVVWRATSGGGSMNGANPDSTFTDLSGFAQDLHILGATPGLQTATAASGSLAGSPVQFSATANSVPTQIVLFAGNNQTAAVNSAVPILPQVKVTDQAGNPSANVTVTFAVASGGGGITSATQQTNPSGIATVGSWTLGTGAGTDNNTLTATAPGLTGSPVTFTASATAGAATTIALNGGNGQTAAVSTAVGVAPSVKATDQFNNPVPNVAVTFTPATGSGSVTGGSPTTDAAGIATVGSWTLGNVAGANKDTLRATSGSLAGSPVVFVASATSGPAAQIAANSTQSQSDTVGLPVAAPPSVLVTDQFGNAVNNVPVTFSIVSGGGGSGGITGASQSTGANGVATIGSWTLGTAAGSNNNSVVATSGTLVGNPVVFNASGTNGPATQMALSTGSGQTSQVAKPVGTPPAVLVSDQFGNPVAGVNVLWSAGATDTIAVPGGGSNASGIAAVNRWVLGTRAGPDTLVASKVGLTGSPVRIVATATAAAPAQVVKFAGDNQSAVAGAPVPVPPAVQTQDQFGNPVGGVAVGFGIASGGGSITGASDTSDASGIASVGSWTLGGVAGLNALTATAPGLAGSPLTFFATGGAAGPTQMALNAGDGQSDTVGATLAIDYAVVVRDGSNNPVPGVTVSWAVTAGGGSITPATSLTDVNGIASATRTLGTPAGIDSATASVGGLTGSPVFFSATAGHGVAKQINVLFGFGASATVNTNVGTLPAVFVGDQFGNPVAGVPVGFAVTSGGGSVTGANPTTNLNGVATVGSWKLGTVAGANSLDATSAGLTGSSVSFPATGLPDAPFQIVVNDGNNQSATVGTAVATPPSVKILDQYGNAIGGGYGVSFAIDSGGGGLTAATPSTDGAGVARVGSWTMGLTAVNNTITATAFGLVGSPVTFVAAATGGPPSRFTSVVLVGAGTVASGTSTTLTLDSKDAFGNPAQSGHTVVFTPFASGTSQGTYGVVTDHGNGTYTSSFTGTVAGTPLTIGATLDGLDVATPQPSITVVPGPAAVIAAFAGDGQSAQVVSSVAINPAAKVTDLNGNGVPGVSVVFLVASGGGTVIGGFQTTNALGIATTGGKWTLGTLAGANTLTASSTGLTGSPVTFTATATPGPFSPNASVTTVSSDSVAAGSAITITLQGKDQFGNNLTTGGQAVTFTLNGGTSDGSLCCTSDNANGTYTASYTGTVSGSPDTVTTVASGSTITTLRPLVRVVPGPAVNLISNLGDGQSAMIGTGVTISPSVLVYDAFGNGVTGAQVTFDPSVWNGRVRDTTGALQLSAVVRSINGIATVPAWILSPFQSFNQMQVSIPTSSVYFGATGTVPSAVGSIRLGNLSLGRDPARVAVSPSTNHIFIATQDTGQNIGVPGITMIDGSADTAISFVGTGEPVSDVAVSDKYGQYYFAYTDNPTLRSGDVNGNTLMKTSANSVNCFSGGGVAVAEHQDRVYFVVPACSRLDVFDAASLNFINTAFVFGTPVDVAADNKGQVYVTNATNGSVDVYCGGSGSGCGFNNLNFVNSIFIGGKPHAIAVDTLSTRIFATNDNYELVVMDGFCNCQQNSIPLPFVGTGVEVNSNTGLIYVSDSATGQVAIYDENFLSQLNVVKVGRGANGIGANPFTNRAYVASRGGRTGAPVSGGSGTVSVLSGVVLQSTVARAGPPFGAALNAVSGRLYAGVDTSSNVVVVDAGTNAVVDAWPVAGATGAIEGVAVNPFNGNVYAAATNANALAVFNSTGVQVAAVGINNPVGLAFDRKTNKLYVGSCGGVVVIDATTNAFKTLVPTAGCGRDIAIDTTTDSIYVASQGGGTVYVIDGATDAVVSTIAVGDPFSVSFDPGRRLIWVVDATGFALLAYHAADHSVALNLPFVNPQWVRVNPKTGATFMPQYQTGVQVLSGELLQAISGLPENFLFNSGGMFLDPVSGRIYVGDYGNHVIHVYQH